MATTGAVIIGFSAALFGVSSVIAAPIPPISSPAGVRPADGQPSVPAPSPEYPRNADGLTYGSLGDAISIETEPDLIYVRATNGKFGYVHKTDLDEADGTAAALRMTTPEERLDWQAERQKLGTVEVPVYDETGKNAIGVFPVAPGGGPQEPLG
jgi:hypothetical protein